MLAHEAGSTPQQIAGQVSGANRTRRAAEREASAARRAASDAKGITPGHHETCGCGYCIINKTRRKMLDLPPLTERRFMELEAEGLTPVGKIRVPA